MQCSTVPLRGRFSGPGSSASKSLDIGVFLHLNTPVAKRSPELAEHFAEVFGVNATGAVGAVYAANFKPGQIVHDAPLVATG